MELVYVWVEKYRSIECQNLNFGSEVLFLFEDGKLTFEENNNYSKNFFSIREHKKNNKNKIINLTGIVGENGVGKTTLLNLITEILERKYENLPKNLESKVKGLEIGYFAIIKYLEEYYLYNPFDILIKIDTNLIKTKKLPKKVLNNRIVVSTVFKGNSFNEFNSDNTLNLSSNFLLSNNISEYKSNNIKWSLDLLNDHKKGLFIFSKVNIPEILNVSLLKNHFDSRAFLVLDSRSDFEKKLSKIQAKNEVTRFKINLFIHVFENLFQVLRVDKNKEDKDIKKEYLTLLVDNILREEKYGNEIDNVLSNTIDELINENFVSSNNLDFYTAAKSFVDSIIEEINTNKFEVNSESSFSISLGNDYIQKFLAIYSNIFTKYKDIFSFYWNGLSSGEEVILELFSRIYSGLKSIKRNREEKTVTILIDEIENNLHPQWQKEIIFELISFIENIGFNQKIQIIVTSHSPFILSDLPHTNVVLLEKSEGSIRRLNSLENHERTFAGNIFSLYTNNFFIKDGLISKFAISKINENYSNILRADKFDVIEKREEYKKLIDIIGEDLIRAKLKNMLEEKMELNTYEQLLNSQEEIKRLSLEIESIKERLENNDKTK